MICSLLMYGIQLGSCRFIVPNQIVLPVLINPVLEVLVMLVLALPHWHSLPV